MSCKVLIVDDSAAIRRLLRMVIEHETDWIICGEAENGQIALDQVQQLNPHIVILDLQMPIMDGLKAAREIAQFYPATIIVMLTLYMHAEVLKAAESVGVQRVFSKTEPFMNLITWLKTVISDRGLKTA